MLKENYVFLPESLDYLRFFLLLFLKIILGDCPCFLFIPLDYIHFSQRALAADVPLRPLKTVSLITQLHAILH